MSSRKNTKKGRSLAAVETPPVGKEEPAAPPAKKRAPRRRRVKDPDPVPTKPRPAEPRVIAQHYIIKERAAIGGMCELYLATHRELGGNWAVKILSADLAEDPGIVERFLDEARIGAVLQHQNIVKVVAVGQEHGLHYLVMNYVEGEDLATRLERKGVLEETEAISIAIQTTQALACAHEAGIVHRDLKPSNIRIDFWGAVVVLDFGIARAMDAADRTRTKVGVRLGTPLYMSPEQIQGTNVDGRSDLYSLGVILYELVSGHNPFEAESQHATYSRHLYNVPPPLNTVAPKVTDRFSNLVARLLSKDAAQRLQTAEEVIAELRSMARMTDIKTPKPSDPDTTDWVGQEDLVRQVPPTALAEVAAPPPAIAPQVSPANIPSDPRSEPNSKKRVLRTVLVSFAAILTVILASAAILRYRAAAPAQYPVAIDASPFARVQVIDQAGHVVFEDETPFSTLLASGRYRLKFDYASESRDREITVPLANGASVRETFWQDGQIHEALEDYLQESRKE